MCRRSVYGSSTTFVVPNPETSEPLVYWIDDLAIQFAKGTTSDGHRLDFRECVFQ